MYRALEVCMRYCSEVCGRDEYCIAECMRECVKELLSDGNTNRLDTQTRT